MNLSHEQIEQLKEQHGELHLIEAPKTEQYVVVKHPTRHHMERFQNAASSAKKLPVAQRDLVLGVAVYPENGQLEATLERFPGLVQTFAHNILEIAGVDEDATAKKL